MNRPHLDRLDPDANIDILNENLDILIVIT